MRKFIFLIALLSALAAPAWAVDVTIPALTQSNFNVTNTGSDRAVTVGVTNGSAAITSSSAFSSWVGQRGFTITIAGTRYEVAYVTDASNATLTSNYGGVTAASVSATWHKYVEARWYSNISFIPYGKNYTIQSGTPGSGAWFARYAASIITINGVATLFWPGMTIDSTVDSVDNNQARYTLGLYRTDGSLVQIYSCSGGTQLRVPINTPTTLSGICAYNSSTVVTADTQTYTRGQIDTRFPSCTAGQLDFFAVTGQSKTCLTVGSGLQITGTTLSATGGGGGGVTGSGTTNYLALWSGTSALTTATDFYRDATTDPGNPEYVLGDNLHIATGSALSRLRVDSDQFVLSASATRSTSANMLTMKGVTSQTGDFLRFTDSASSIVFRVEADGDVRPRGVAYSWPSSNSAGVLTNNGTGTLTWAASSTSAIRQAINVKLDHNCVGDGVTNDTACIAAAINAAELSTGKVLYFPTGTYLTDPITTDGNSIVIEGDGPGRTFIKSRTNGALLTFDNSITTTHSITIRDISLQGFSSGTSNHGIVISGANDRFNFKLSNVRFTEFAGTTILSTGGTLFTSTFEDVDINQPATASGHAFDLLGAQTNTLIRTYVHNVADNKAAYRLRSGSWTLIGVNGVDSGNNVNWGIFGQQTSDDGTDTYAQITFIGSNIEDWSATDGVIFRIGSVGSFYNTKFDTLPGGTFRAIKFNYVDVGFSGVFDAESGFLLNGGAAWTNSLPVHSYNPPFIQVGSDEIASYYDTNLSASVSLSAIKNNLNVSAGRATTDIKRLSLGTSSGQGIDGDVRFGTDNTNDVGTNSGQRPRSVYVGTSIVMANGTTTVGGQNWTITGGANPQIAFDDATTAGRLQLLTAGGGVQLLTTSAHPLLLGANGTAAWSINSSNNLIVNSGSRTIGLAAGNRPTIVYASTSLNAGTPGVTTGSVVFGNLSNSNTFTLQSGATGSNLTFTLPTADGTAGQCLQTNGSGVLSFAACGGGSGTVNTGAANAITYYPSSGTTVDDTSGFAWQNANPNVTITSQNATHEALRLVSTLNNDATVPLFKAQTADGSGVVNIDPTGDQFASGVENMLLVKNTSSARTANFGVVDSNTNKTPYMTASASAGDYILLGANGSATGATNLINQTRSAIVQAGAVGGLYIVASDGSGQIKFGTGGTATTNERMSISNAGLVTITNSSAATLYLNGGSSASAVRIATAGHPGSGGGLSMGFVGGSQSSGPGIWWTNNTYANTSGMWLSNGFNFQGASSTHDPIKIRKGTGTSSDGSVIFEFQPSAGYINLNPFGTSAGNTTTIRFLELAANGSNYFEVKGADNQASSYVLTLPNNNSYAGALLRTSTYSGTQITTEWGTIGGAEYDNGNVSGSVTLDFNNGPQQKMRLTGNITTLTLSNIRNGQIYIISFIQDGTGSRTTATPATIKNAGGAITLTTTANAQDDLWCRANSTTLYCAMFYDIK